ncbi:indolepyruvate ferredoxin oxidoreductase family protein [Streptomyces sp. SP2-10]|uniref:indolepyruvate ferredoxin oxidoreductase family protein n=1 Tax=Streptomyces sp. SP2-10 TaxID=2873385 RepID=UPI001CA7AD61|nr:indolepyruvate ferredoxin oxidoreductase family protein [Streptomyces sp. SP2-10]MBY8840647.1 indolepyruvate ferredoxin oxidoreductase family protein [Streptomyces sp. SP2-10]
MTTIVSADFRPHDGERDGVPVDPRQRYQATAGCVQLTGIQALARLPIDQHRRDLAAGKDVATFISGYEGSPLAGYDLELGRLRSLLDANDVRHVPGLNEEAAATAVQGSQLVNTLDGATRDGVLGVWYGKAPGLDRATDALRHGNLMGAHPAGGALVLVGDDPAAKSSSVPCSSELALMDLAIPFLNPADSQEVLDLGLHAVELSRASGLWVGLKIVTAVADGSSLVDLGAERPAPVLPPGSGRHEPTARLLQPTLGPLERDLMTTRLRLAREYCRLNRLNRVELRGDDDVIGIVASGRTYRELRAALDRLGLTDARLTEAGIRLLKIAMPYPLDAETIVEFADGLDQIIVVEEKRSFIETAVREALYGHAGAPRVFGKEDEQGKELIPSYGELDADILVRPLARELAARGVPVEQQRPERIEGRTQLPLISLPKRAPYFCSGCPHNSSTKVPDDSLVGGGIGCHAMVLLMDEDQVGTVTGLSQMGGEGLQWIGMAPYTRREHYLQNLGDGTFDHSGSLAIRAAVAAGVNITYKLLYNSAVAMTGGQSAVGAMDLRQIVDVLRAEKVARIIVTSDDVRRTRRMRLPHDVTVRDRGRMEEAQRELAGTPGVTVLVHDQECATEKRRKWKRGKLDKPTTRVFINERICEGCGDCGHKSNCLSVQPVETEFGRKTQIHQASCNVDFSCLKGDCPAFMTITGVESAKGSAGGTARDPRVRGEAPLPDPVPTVTGGDFGVRLTGVGGTGVVTISQILATAGLLAGWTPRSLDQTGLAQKGGAVVSDIRFHRAGEGRTNKLGAGECDLYLGCDILVAADAANLTVTSPDRTVAVLNTARVATGHMVADVRQTFPDTAAMSERLLARVRPGAEVLDARETVLALLGDDQYLNTFLVGVGFQLGALPLPAAAIEEAVRINGVAVEANLQAFRYGRLWVADRSAVTAALGTDGSRGSEPADTSGDPSPLGKLVARRIAELTAYQDARYAARYAETVDAVRERERKTVPGTEDLATAVARNLFKLMAYKDEYEVARLALDEGVAAELAEQFGPGARAQWNLQPPVLRALGMRRKIRLGGWFRPGFTALYGMRRLRGTALDPFGRAHVRKVERALLEEYAERVTHLLDGLTPANHAVAVQIASLPDMVRGFEEVKLRNVEAYRARLRELTERFDRDPGEGRVRSAEQGTARAQR